jgi:hypothetical protein
VAGTKLKGKIMGLLETKEVLLAREKELNIQIEELVTKRDSTRKEIRDLTVVNDFVCGTTPFRLEQQPGVARLYIRDDNYTKVVAMKASGENVYFGSLEVLLSTAVVEALHTALQLFKDHQ